MSLITALMPSKSPELPVALPTVEELQAHYDLPSYVAGVDHETAQTGEVDSSQNTDLELELAFRDIGYARVGAHAVRTYLPKILESRGVSEGDARQEANLLSNRIEQIGTHFKQPEQRDNIHGQEVADTIKALEATVVHELPSQEHPDNASTYAGSLALFMLEHIPKDGGPRILLGSAKH